MDQRAKSDLSYSEYGKGKLLIAIQKKGISMTVEKHDLVHEFPESRDAIHELKMNNSHFARLFDQYHDKDHEVHRIENGTENTSDDYLEVRKKERLKLKDELYKMIKDFEQA